MAARAMTVASRCIPALLVVVVGLCAWPAAANSLPSTLQPAIAAPGLTILVEGHEPGRTVVLEGPETIELEAAWSDSPADGVWARCPVPAETPAGRYDLVVGGERRIGAVWVLEELPESYPLAFVAGGGPDHLSRAIDAAMAAEALALVFIGPTNGPDAGAYARALEQAPLPVLVTGVGERTHSPYPFAAVIGEDAILFHDPRVTRLGAADGDLHRLRRATRASRWSIAVWPLYDPFVGRRAQLILFSDDPVDLFIAPLEEIPQNIEEAPLPGFWPDIRFEPLAAGAADTLLVVQVSTPRLRPARIPMGLEETNDNPRPRRRATPDNDGGE